MDCRKSVFVAIERKTLRKRASISNLDGTNNKEIGQSNSEYEHGALVSTSVRGYEADNIISSCPLTCTYVY